MPELPEIYNIAQQMDKELKGKKIIDVVVEQEKCLNVPESSFKAIVTGKVFKSTIAKGKWIISRLEPDAYFLLSLGMGGEVLYHKPQTPVNDKHRVLLKFDDNSALSVSFWWFGYAHAVNASELNEHKMTSKLGMCPFDSDFTFEKFNQLMEKKKRSAIKSMLMKQENIAGIGNLYIQDILFKARLHPSRKIMNITQEEQKKLYNAIMENLRSATELGGLSYEKDLYNNNGRFKDFLVGYKEDKPCPVCGTIIEKIKTGSTSSYICPECQKC